MLFILFYFILFSTVIIIIIFVCMCDVHVPPPHLIFKIFVLVFLLVFKNFII